MMAGIRLKLSFKGHLCLRLDLNLHFCSAPLNSHSNPSFPHKTINMNIIEKYHLDDRDVDRIVSMAWEDRTPFEAIEYQFGLSEKEVIKLMKRQMRESNWRKWRARVQGRKTKHAKLRNKAVDRFRASRQKQITRNRISKR
jgi:uncharacterized protein (TIGR03643 family)